VSLKKGRIRLCENSSVFNAECEVFCCRRLAIPGHLNSIQIDDDLQKSDDLEKYERTQISILTVNFAFDYAQGRQTALKFTVVRKPSH
jgi:hypothetical protein